jgi:hypothetical protein
MGKRLRMCMGGMCMKKTPDRWIAEWVVCLRELCSRRTEWVREEEEEKKKKKKKKKKNKKNKKKKKNSLETQWEPDSSTA